MNGSAPLSGLRHGGRGRSRYFRKITISRIKVPLWGLGGLRWTELAKHVWNEANEDDLWGRAAQLSYYFLLALFPLLLVLMALLGIFANKGTELRQNLIGYLAQVMPASA